MLTKKQMYRWSFPVLLIIITFTAPIIGQLLDTDEGILNIALYPGKNQEAELIANELCADESIISYTLCASDEEAHSRVKKGKSDCAWIFNDDFYEGLSDHAQKGFSNPVITIIEREENIALMLSREKLYGKIFPRITYQVYKNYIRSEIGDKEKISDEKIDETYTEMERKGSLIEIKPLGSDKGYSYGDNNLLLSPIRGFLSILIMLCGFVCALYFIKEKNDGIYVGMAFEKLFFPAFGACFSAVFLSSAASCISMCLAGFSQNILWEIFVIFVFSICASVFCTLICLSFKNVTLAGALIPPFIILMLVMCPIFFNVKFVVWPKYLLPPYYYLMGIHNPEYNFYCIIYSLVLMTITGLICRFKKA